MAYTANDLTLVRKAIIDLATGKRVTTFRTANGKTLSYADTDIEKLRSLERSVASEVAASEGRTHRRTRLAVTNKGL